MMAFESFRKNESHEIEDIVSAFERNGSLDEIRQHSVMWARALEGISIVDDTSWFFLKQQENIMGSSLNHATKRVLVEGDQPLLAP